MKLFNRTGRYSTGNLEFVGRYKKFVCTIYFSSEIGAWYYVVDSKDVRDIRYNSLWNGVKFKAQEECVNGCQKYIDEVNKNAKISKKMG